MPRLEINLLKPRSGLVEENKKPKKFWKKIAILLVVFLFFGIFFSLRFSPQTFPSSLSSEIFFRPLSSLPFNHDRPLKGERENRINFLILGMGGEGHDGAYLTDTIILASFRPADKKIALLSIPRDLLVQSSEFGWIKINALNAYYRTKEPEKSVQLTAQEISRIFDLPIHYYFCFDFQGFKRIIDELGGIKIYVDRAFTDFSYPTDDFKYQTISFKEGWQIMDGEEALKYARSRHGTNGENSDFARAKRQQKIILATLHKIFSFETLLNQQRIKNLFNLLKDHLETNLSLWEGLRLAQLAYKENFLENLHLEVLDDSPSGPLEAKYISGAFYLVPKEENWFLLKEKAKHLLSESTNLPPWPKEKIVVEIRNGTNINGLAAAKAKILNEKGFVVKKIGNSKTKNFQKTIIYSFKEADPETLNLLQETLQAQIIIPIDTWLQTNTFAHQLILDPNQIERDPETNFLIILGFDQKNQI